MRKSVVWAAGFSALLAAPGCRDVTRFSTGAGESYCGDIVAAPIVQRGFADDVRMRMTFDADRLGDAPGTLSTSDRLLTNAPMRTLPELSHDPLLTFNFGEGRDKNLLFAIDPDDAQNGPTIMVVLSLMHTGDTEVRLLRGAPVPGTASAPTPSDGAPLFGLFAPLKREPDQCSF